MRYALAFLPVLACAGLMYGCIRMMMSGSRGADASRTPDLEARVQELERELGRLRAERDDADRPVQV